MVQVERVRTVISEGVKEIWLSSEDTGAYGKICDKISAFVVIILQLTDEF